MKNIRPICALLFLAPAAGELLTASTPLLTFLQPPTLALLVLLGYGLPVLLIREYITRARTGAPGLFAAGLAYGIFNEGLLAKTMIRRAGLPLNGFDNYGYIFGIDVPWAVTISVWHAAGVVLFPVLIVHWLFPEVSERPWLGKKLLIALTALLLVIASLGFLDAHNQHGTRGQFGVFAAFMFVLLLIAGFLPDRSVTTPGLWRPAIWPLFAGATTTISYLMLSGFAGHKPPLAAFFFLLFAVVTGYALLFRSAGWQNESSIIFAVGGYMTSTLLGMITRVTQRVAALETLVTGAAALAVMVWWVLGIRKAGVQAVRSGAIES